MYCCPTRGGTKNILPLKWKMSADPCSGIVPHCGYHYKFCWWNHVLFLETVYHAVRREYNNAIFVHNDIGLSSIIKKNDQKFLFENRTNVRVCL
jgi:hypothetical protein